MSTTREIALARAIDRLSAKDLMTFVQMLIGYNAPSSSKWELQKQVLECAKHHLSNVEKKHE
ncbi:MAG TPA: hypothetical protein VIY48_02020 [Candidatus Paceibacterota bacterium]